jgi:hypothetical protein
MPSVLMLRNPFGSYEMQTMMLWTILKNRQGSTYDLEASC